MRSKNTVVPSTRVTISSTFRKENHNKSLYCKSTRQDSYTRFLTLCKKKIAINHYFTMYETTESRMAQAFLKI